MKWLGRQTGGVGGFTLVEVIVAMLIASVLMGGVVSVFIKFVNSTSEQSSLDDINAEVSALFKVMEKDVMMAGYGVPSSTRVASQLNCSVSDQTFCLDNSDRLFLADGWGILKSITDNGEVDGQVASTYMTYLANKKSSSAGGYSTQLKADVAAGTTALSVLSFNVNASEELHSSATDFAIDSALIIGDGTRVEGHTLSAVTAPDSLRTPAKDPLINSFVSASTNYVVPAAVWYVRSDPDGKKYSNGDPVYWLYRNGYKVLPYVSNFKVLYGYDAKSDGLQQWSGTVPPANADIPTGVDGNAAFSLSYLKAIQITLTVKSVLKSGLTTTPYQTVILLRN